VTEQNVRMSLGILAAEFTQLKSAARFTQWVEFIMRERLQDEDIAQAVDWVVLNRDTLPSLAEFVEVAKRHRRERQEARASVVRRDDGWRPQMRCKRRACSCGEALWLIADHPEPRQRYATAHARLWCPDCMKVHLMEKDAVSGGLRYWLTPEEVDAVEAEGMEPVVGVGLGYHHMMELAARQAGAPGEKVARMAFTIRQVEAETGDGVVPALVEELQAAR
jgi:hypothetical protein